ncbi:hypothetical protein AGLY_004532 [Aphis glycines]|uniref:Uncharacterized protein n=1 Tax=Aphis glycines TaxID=307491 RepID=A0A6G0U0T5_APHGL|nr:hypothetical protein AGLY_004532 [Aphis glycines]
MLPLCPLLPCIYISLFAPVINKVINIVLTGVGDLFILAEKKMLHCNFYRIHTILEICLTNYCTIIIIIIPPITTYTLINFKYVFKGNDNLFFIMYFIVINLLNKHKMYIILCNNINHNIICINLFTFITSIRLDDIYPDSLKNKNSQGNLFGRYQIYKWKHEHRQEVGCSGIEKTTSKCVGMNYGVKRRTFFLNGCDLLKLSKL